MIQDSEYFGKYKWFLGITFALCLLAGCKEEEDLYGIFRIDVVTCVSEEGQIVFKRDDGIFLIPASSFYRDAYTTGQRALLHYTPLNAVDGETENVRREVKIEIKGISPVTTQPVLFYTSAQLLSVPDDEIYLESLWLSGGYINIRFQIEVNRPEVKHRLSLICNRDRPGEEGTVRLELRHDRHGDIAGYRIPGYASFCVDTFDLTEIKDFKIRINASNYEDIREFRLRVPKADD